MGSNDTPHLVLDNYGTHKTAMIHDWLARRPRFYLHFTPTSASWILDQSSRAVVRGRHRETDPARDAPEHAELEQAIREYLTVYNEDPNVQEMS